jgi:uncharacterized protein YjdB
MTTRNRTFAASLLLLPVLILSACSGASSSGGDTTPTLSSITVTPTSATLVAGGTTTLTVTAHLSDGSAGPLNVGVTFSTSAASVATVSAAGVVTAVAGGSATITATVAGKTATSVITVTPTLLSIAASPTTVTLSQGGTQALTVTATYDAGSPVPVTTTATYATSAASVATVSPTGVVTAVVAGSATITVTYSGKTTTVPVTVNAPVLQSIAASPTSKTLSINATQALAVTATYDVGPTTDVTTIATYASSATSVATVSPTGVVTGVAGGTATITATYLTKTATVAVTVNPVVLQSIAITPASATLSIAGTSTLTVTATYDVGPTADVTTGATYASSNTAVATVSPAGVVTAVTPGTATITATYQTKTATMAVTVNPPLLLSIAVAPATVGLRVGNSQALTVTATYDAGPKADVTSTATYGTSDSAVATVSPAGVVTAVAAGPATITATYLTKTATSGVTVTAITTTGGLVFYDDYDPGVTFVSFNGPAPITLTRDTAETRAGRASLRIDIGSGGWAGGALAASLPRDLRAFNALTFWAKSNVPMTVDNMGIGDSGTGRYLGANDLTIQLTTTWTRYVIPMPDPTKAVGMDGLFHIADGAKNYSAWFSDIQYESLPSTEVAAPTGATVNWPGAQTVGVGSAYPIAYQPNTVSFTTPALPNGGKLTDVSFVWYTLTSSNPAVATVSATGLVTGVSAGTASITARMNGIVIPGNLAITVTAPLAVPTTTLTPNVAAHPVGNVVSVYNSAAVYTDLLGVNFFPGWGQATTFADAPIAGKTVKKYSGMNYQGWDFAGTPVNASTFTHLHVDIWTPNATKFGVAVINFGTPHTEFTVPFNSSTTPTITQGAWISLDIPLTAFTGVTFEAVSQIKWVDDGGAGPGPAEFATFYIDNVYFWK